MHLLAVMASRDAQRDFSACVDGTVQVTFVNAISAAARAARSRPPDVVVLDLEGLGDDVVGICRRAKAILGFGAYRMPLVVIGAVEKLQRASPALDPTMDEIICTPLQPAEVALRLDACLRACGAWSRTSSSEPQMQRQRYRVLIVDDIPANVLLLEKYLEQDYDVHVAYNGATALQIAASQKPDIILLDVRMPGMNGFEVCEALKRSEETRLTPVIMVTANADDRDSKLQALQKGADDFLIKPIDWPELLARVRNLIRVKALVEENRMLEREKERNQIMREVIFAVTGGKLELTDDVEIARLRSEGQLLTEIEVRRDTDIAAARDAAERALAGRGVDPDHVFDLVLCVSEASTNAVKHAGGGVLQIYDFGTALQMWMCDDGAGIDFSVLPRSTLMKGWSSKPSLGCGFTIMLDMLDRLILNTSKRGTTVIMEMLL